MTLSTTSIGLAEHIRRCVAGEDLRGDEMREAIGLIMDGQATHAQVSALLVALHVKGETAEEVVGAAEAMRARSLSVHCVRRPLMDVCGTGGDGSMSFNISTAVALVVAGAGVAVAKHGNRSMSSRSGSADALEALGVDIQAASMMAQHMLEQHGIAFLFAQAHHPAMRFVAPVRREIGIRTVFNLLGPLTNPAGATHQLVGVAHENALLLVAQALRALGSERAAVVRAQDGFDEVSLSCTTRVIEWNGSQLLHYAIEPEMVGLQRRPATDLASASPQESAQRILHVLSGKPGAHRDVVVFNAALALYIAGMCGHLRAGRDLAERSIDSGGARRALQALMDAAK